MLDPKEEAKFVRLRDMCRELKLPSLPEIFIRGKIHDHNGILVFDDVLRGHSYTRNFYNFILGTACEVTSTGDTTFGAGHENGKRTNGTVSSAAGYAAARSDYTGLGFGILNSTANSTYGIILGTGSSAFSVEDYAVNALISHGVASGNLLYSAMTYGVATYTGGSKSWSNVLTRLFNNNSGGSITVRETALYYNSYMFNAVAAFMMERSVLAVPWVVANGAQLTVTYTITMDFSAID